MLLTAISVSNPRAEPFSSTRPDDLRSRIAAVDDRIVILAIGSLHRFDPESEAWTTTLASQGLAAPPLRSLSITGDRIWISGIGTSFSDLRFDDWQSYPPGSGFPGRVVHSVEADDDYAYAGTDEGAARFDRYIFEWESIAGEDAEPLGPVLDVAVGEDRVWFALADGVVEYRKETESLRRLKDVDEKARSKVLAFRQTNRYLWVLTDSGFARYDKESQGWTRFRAGGDFPDARINQWTLDGEDLWIGTDRGLWSYRSDAGIWREDESTNGMPGQSVRRFALTPDAIWVVTETAFALYEKGNSRWIDFTSSVPMLPIEPVELFYRNGLIIYAGVESIIYGLGPAGANPSLYSYRSESIPHSDEELELDTSAFELGLDDAGLGLRTPSGRSIHVKGGATIYVEDIDEVGEVGLGEVSQETRIDLTLNGRLGHDRTLSGFYDSTDPDNTAYQLTYRGNRDDAIRSISVGEIEQETFNTRLAPGAGLTGGKARLEFGRRSEETHRRLITTDVWAGDRRTIPGRDVFRGGNRIVERTVRDIDFAVRQVYQPPDGWTIDDLRNATLFRDDRDDENDDANTLHTELGGIPGSWDQVWAGTDYFLGPGSSTLILATPLGPDEILVALQEGRSQESAVDLTDLWLANHYWMTQNPIPGTLEIGIVDSTGADVDPSGSSYLAIFGLDSDRDGAVDDERFSPITGFLSFPDPMPFPSEIYEDGAQSLYTIRVSYRTQMNTFQLSRRDIVSGSERISVDRQSLRSGVDYSIIPSSGMFVFFEHVLLDDDSVIEIDYLYEVGSGTRNADIGGTEPVVSGQIGLAPSDLLFLGAQATRWSESNGADVTTADLNARFEWKDRSRFLRVTPEIALSRLGDDPVNAGSDDAPAASNTPSRNGTALGIGLQGRYHGLELTGEHRDLGSDFRSFENRKTLLGQLRDDSRLFARLDLSQSLQAEVEWNRSRSDSVAYQVSTTIDSTDYGRGEESSLIGTVRLLRSGMPNVSIQRGRVQVDSPGQVSEKTMSRGELEINAERLQLGSIGIQRLWLRAFLQRSEREFTSADSSLTGDRTTDHAFVRFNGAVGSPLAWNVAWEDRRTHKPEEGEEQNLRRFQRIDATLQTRPHSSLDAFLRWEADRDLFWNLGGENGGFSVERRLLSTTQFYPGHLVGWLAPLTFRFDLGKSESEVGEPGSNLPGSRSLWSKVTAASDQQEATNRIVEGRVQFLSWLRLVERWEMESELEEREGIELETESSQLENRFEIRPSGGLLTLRTFLASERARERAEEERRRFSGQWDQLWGQGILTYLAMDAERIESTDRSIGDLSYVYAPQARITWRRSHWKIDANLGGALTWTRTKDLSTGAAGGWLEKRRQSLTFSWNFQPIRILSARLQYVLSRSESDEDGGGKVWKVDHDLKLRFLIRA